jgi:hypothetical protein
MSADPTDTRSPHLDLADLIAEVTGQPIDGRVREHLTRCERCRAEANRWNLVADGVRGLAAAAPQVAQPARPRRAGPRALADPRRRPVLAATAAAVLVLLAGAGYGAAAALTRHAPGTVLTAVSGCAALEQASGTLEQVNGSSLVIRTANGQPVTLTTTAATKVGEAGASGALLGDITDGASVTVVGPSSDGAIAAFSVIIANPAQQHPQPPPGMVVAKGTVSDVSTLGFTVVTSGGTRVPVTTSSDTVVGVPDASPGQLPAGATILAVGYAGPDGTLSAEGVAAILRLPQGNPQAHGQAHVHVKNCSPASIDSALSLGG